MQASHILRSILILAIVLLATDVQAVPYRVPTVPPATSLSTKDLSRKIVERKLGRKLMFVERQELRRLRRQVRQYQRLNNQKKVRIILKDKRSRKIRGNVLRIEKDSIYLVNYASGKRAALEGFEKPLAIPVSRVKEISLPKLSRKAAAQKTGMITSFILFLISTGLFISGDRKVRTAKREIQSGALWIGLYGMIIFLIVGFIFMVKFLKNKISLTIDGNITMEQMEILEPYILI